MKYIYAPIILLIFYIISVIRVRREMDIWLMPWIWVNGIWGSLFYANGIKKDGSQGDASFMTLNQNIVSEAVEYSKAMMIQEGVVYPEQYIPEAFDCENFAQAMKHYIDLYIAREYGQDGYGIPTSVVGYLMDKGGGHAVVQILVDGKAQWWQPYPHIMKEMKLSLREIGSLTPITSG